MERKREQLYFTVVGIGNEGVEMIVSKIDRLEALRFITRMQLRARFNSHRNIKLYSYVEDFEVTYEHFGNKKYLAKVLKHAAEVGI